jgi:hypothetical protein
MRSCRVVALHQVDGIPTVPTCKIIRQRFGVTTFGTARAGPGAGARIGRGWPWTAGHGWIAPDATKICPDHMCAGQGSFVLGGGSRIRTLEGISRRIYSPLPFGRTAPGYRRHQPCPPRALHGEHQRSFTANHGQPKPLLSGSILPTSGRSQAHDQYCRGSSLLGRRQRLRPARKGEPNRAGRRFFKPLHQTIESIFDTYKGQLVLQRHGGKAPAASWSASCNASSP